MIHKAGFPALALIGVALFAACGGGGSGTTTTIRTVVPRTVVAVATTGVPDLDQIIIAAADADTIELAGLTGYQRIPCKKDIPQPAPGDPPLCRDNESDGASVEVLPSAKCEGGWVRMQIHQYAPTGATSTRKVRQRIMRSPVIDQFST